MFSVDCKEGIPFAIKAVPVTGSAKSHLAFLLLCTQLYFTIQWKNSVWLMSKIEHVRVYIHIFSMVSLFNIIQYCLAIVINN